MKQIYFLCLVLLATNIVVTSCETEDPVRRPKACFVVGLEAMAGVLVSFNSSCSELALTYNWSFGDGGSSTDANPTHTYNEGGEYMVTLTITSSDGTSDEETQAVSVAAPSVIEHSGSIDEDETWVEGTHLITGDVRVNGAILTIEPGAVILFASGRSLYLGYNTTTSGATLLANGTEENPITFTSSGATKTAGDWNYIWFGEGASTISSMQHCLIEYGGGYSENYGAVHIASSAVSISHSSVRFSASHGVSLDDDGYFESFNGNTVEQNALSVIRIYGNHVHTIGEENALISERGIQVRADDVEQTNVSWLKQSTAYVLEGDLKVGSSSGAALSLAPGVEIRMGGRTAIYVGYGNGKFGTLQAVGTEGDRIKFTSNAPTVAKSAGDWDYIWFDEGAGTNSKFDFCDFEYGGGYSDNYGMIYAKASAIAVTNSTIRHSEAQGIVLGSEAMFTDCSNNVFEDNGTYPIELHGNYAHTIGMANSFNTGPGILVNGDRIEQADVSWLNHQVPYVVDGGIDLGSASGSKLIIEPGTQVNFTSGSRLRVGYFTGTYGILVAAGDPENRITFSSSAPAGFGSAGDWQGIWFYNGTTSGNLLDHCSISFGGGQGSNSGNLNFHNETVGVPVISNCQISNSGAWGMYLTVNATPTLTDNGFEGNASGDRNR